MKIEQTPFISCVFQPAGQFYNLSSHSHQVFHPSGSLYPSEGEDRGACWGENCPSLRTKITIVLVRGERCEAHFTRQGWWGAMKERWKGGYWLADCEILMPFSYKTTLGWVFCQDSIRPLHWNSLHWMWEWTQGSEYLRSVSDLPGVDGVLSPSLCSGDQGKPG